VVHFKEPEINKNY